MVEFARTPLFCEIVCTVIIDSEDDWTSTNPVDIYDRFIQLCWERKTTECTVTNEFSSKTQQMCDYLQ